MKANPLFSTVKILICMLTVSFWASCNQADLKENVAMEATDIQEHYNAVPESDAPSKPNLETTAIPEHLKIIKSAKVRYKVVAVKAATAGIKSITSKFDGYISDLRFQNNLYSIENRFTIKVPAKHFDMLLDSIGTVAEFIEYEHITTKDVTEEYMDISTRLATKLEVQKRYESILRKKATTVEDILATEEKLRVIQEEIEAAQGRLKYLTNKVSYSTIQIDLYETVIHQEEPKSYSRTFVSKIKEGFSFGWNLVEGIFLGLIYIWPLVILGVLVFFFIRRRVKK